MNPISAMLPASAQSGGDQRNGPTGEQEAFAGFLRATRAHAGERGAARETGVKSGRPAMDEKTTSGLLPTALPEPGADIAASGLRDGRLAGFVLDWKMAETGGRKELDSGRQAEVSTERTDDETTTAGILHPLIAAKEPMPAGPGNSRQAESAPLNGGSGGASSQGRPTTGPVAEPASPGDGTVDGERVFVGAREFSATASGSEATSEAPAAEPLKLRIVSDQTVPLPFPTRSASSTVTHLAAAITDGSPETVTATQEMPVDGGDTEQPTGPVRELRIQLRPESLGEVTARLRMSGEQLSVEINTDRPEAFRQLSGDRDTIVSSLRSLGFNVDDVTIQHQPATGSGTMDMTSSRGGDNGASQSRSFERPSDGQSRHGDQRDGSNKNEASTHDGKRSADRSAAGDLYI